MGRYQRKILAAVLIAAVLFAGCAGRDEASSGIDGGDIDIAATDGADTEESSASDGVDKTDSDDIEENDIMTMRVKIGNSVFTAVLEENDAVDALIEMMRTGPVTIDMSDYGGFEKVGSLGRNLPASDSRTTTQAGDIVLYQGSRIVLFYGSNSWSYTKLGRVNDTTGWTEALGRGDVRVTFYLED